MAPDSWSEELEVNAVDLAYVHMDAGVQLTLFNYAVFVRPIECFAGRRSVIEHEDSRQRTSD